MGTVPATGSSVLMGLGLELEYGIPSPTGLVGHRAILPLKAGLMGEEAESPAVNQSGFLEPALPGKKGGKYEWKCQLTAAALLEPLQHMCRSVTKTTLTAGVYRYRFVPSNTGVDNSFYALVTNLVERWWLYGIKFKSLDLDIGDNEAIPMSLKGDIGHGTRLSVAEPDEGNTGTYTLGPILRGPLADRTAGDVYVKVASLSPLTFKVEQTDGTPTFSGSAVQVAMEDGRATWQNLQGADGSDLGFWTENYDPLEVVWPGTATDHGDLEVGDIFAFRVTWPNPAVTFLSGVQPAFTSAHWVVQSRPAGSSDAYSTSRVNTGTISVEWPTTVDRGASSRYPFGITRDGQFMVSIEMERKLLDARFIDVSESRARLDLLLSFLGRQLSGGYRESVIFALPSCRLDDDSRDPASEKAIKEKVKLNAERTSDGSPPAQIDVITTRNWTPWTAV